MFGVVFFGFHLNSKEWKIMAECTTASQPELPEIFSIADEMARNSLNEQQIWPFLSAKRMATATVS